MVNNKLLKERENKERKIIDKIIKEKKKLLKKQGKVWSQTELKTFAGYERIRQARIENQKFRQGKTIKKKTFKEKLLSIFKRKNDKC